MEHLKRIEREDVYANYRGRMPRLQAEQQKSPKEISRQALERMFDREMPKIVEQFNAISAETESTERLKNILLAHLSMDDLTFDVFKEFSSPDGGALRIQCFIGREEIAQYILLREDGQWRLTDRFVDKRFRGKGLAAVLLAAVERFVKLYADQSGFPEHIIIEAGQPSVLVTYFNKGYIPQTAQDAKMLEEMFAGDPKLCLDYAVDISSPRSRKPRATGLDLYCFEKIEEEKTIDNAYRVTLEKRFEPGETAVRREQGKIQRAVLNV